MSPIEQPAIPKGSTVLVTGVNGLIASHVADQFLKLGYRVRGTVRNSQKNAWVSKVFTDQYGPGKFELVTVPDIEATNALGDAIKGVAAVAHTVSNVTQSPVPDEVISPTIQGVISALEAAAREPSVKRFVLTSSSTAAFIPKPNDPKTITTDTWNDEAIAVATRPPPYEADRIYPVYAASKTLGEKEAWKWMGKKKPGFVLNTVLPTTNFGASLDTVNQGHTSSAGMLASLFKGEQSLLMLLPAQYFVDVQDNAMLHVAAAIHPDVVSERIFAFAEPYNGDSLLALFRKLYPNRQFPENFQSEQDLSVIEPMKRAEQLLRDLGKDGWTSLEDSVQRNVEDLI